MPLRAVLQTTVMLALVGGVAACSSHVPTDRLTATQQQLEAAAVDRAIAKISWPDLAGRPTYVEVGSPAEEAERTYLEEAVKFALHEHGAVIVDDRSEAEVEAIVLADAVGVDRAETFLGIPSIESTLVPLALPELPIYRSTRQVGVAQLEVGFADRRDGGLFHRAGPAAAGTFVHERKYLVLFSTLDTDLEDRPLEERFPQARPTQ